MYTLLLYLSMLMSFAYTLVCEYDEMWLYFKFLVFHLKELVNLFHYWCVSYIILSSRFIKNVLPKRFNIVWNSSKVIVNFWEYFTSYPYYSRFIFIPDTFTFGEFRQGISGSHLWLMKYHLHTTIFYTLPHLDYAFSILFVLNYDTKNFNTQYK